MSISGLVVTLCAEDGAAAQAVSRMSADARLNVGERFGRRLALVAETMSVEEDRELWDQLRGLSGVVNLDVTFVHLDAPCEGISPDAAEEVSCVEGVMHRKESHAQH